MTGSLNPQVTDIVRMPLVMAGLEKFWPRLQNVPCTQAPDTLLMPIPEQDFADSVHKHLRE